MSQKLKLAAADSAVGFVEKVIYGGHGLIRHNNFVILVPGAHSGEKVRVKITRLKRSYAIAELREILAPSADRIEPNCRTVGAHGKLARIPGCSYDHLRYDAEVAVKQQQLLEFIKHMPNAENAEILAPRKSPQELHYRNKLIVHARNKRGAIKLGYQEERSHRVVDISRCPLACEAINVKLSEIRSSKTFRKIPDKAKVTLRHAGAGGVLWWINRPSARSWITEESAIGKLRVSSDGFYQVNPGVSHALTQTVAEWFKQEPTDNILDLYCGVGLFGLACRQQGGGNLVGIESGKRAVLAARHNAARLGLEADFQARELGRTELALQQHTKDASQTTCIVDPPRAGMDKSVVAALAGAKIPRILYISCDPSTLRRDLKIFAAAGGYRLKRIQLFDMFPRTAHFEIIAEIVL